MMSYLPELGKDMERFIEKFPYDEINNKETISNLRQFDKDATAMMHLSKKYKAIMVNKMYDEMME